MWARNTFAGGASNSRVIRTSGTLGSATISVSWVPVAVMSMLLSGVSGWVGRRPGCRGRSDVVRHRPEDVVEAAVALLGLAAVALDPLGHQVEDLRFEVDRTALGLAGCG